MISLRLQRPDPYNKLLFARRQGQGQQLVHTEAASVGTFFIATKGRLAGRLYVLMQNYFIKLKVSLYKYL